LSRQLFARKPIAELLVEGESPYALKRALGAGDLVMLGIGAVIGAGIFWAWRARWPGCATRSWRP